MCRQPALDRVLAPARARAVDAILVRAFDRFGRKLRHFLLTLDELASLGVTLISLREQFALPSPIGWLVAGSLAGVAEFEQALIRERIQARHPEHPRERIVEGPVQGWTGNEPEISRKSYQTSWSNRNMINTANSI